MHSKLNNLLFELRMKLNLKDWIDSTTSVARNHAVSIVESRSPVSIASLDRRSRSPVSIFSLDRQSWSPVSIASFTLQSRSSVSITSLDRQSRSSVSITSLDRQSRSPVSIASLTLQSRSSVLIFSLDHQSRSSVSIASLDRQSRSPVSIASLVGIRVVPLNPIPLYPWRVWNYNEPNRGEQLHDSLSFLNYKFSVAINCYTIIDVRYLNSVGPCAQHARTQHATRNTQHARTLSTRTHDSSRTHNHHDSCSPRHPADEHEICWQNIFPHTLYTCCVVNVIFTRFILVSYLWGSFTIDVQCIYVISMGILGLCPSTGICWYRPLSEMEYSQKRHRTNICM